jgi:hypothetical protein
VGAQQRQRVPGQAEGGVDEDGAGAGAGRAEQLGDPVEQDRHVHRGRARPPGAGSVLLIVGGS